MRRRIILAVAFVGTLGIALFAGANILSALERPSYTATYSMRVGSLTRTYEVIAPTAALPASAPLIVVLHGIAAPVSAEVQRDKLVPYVNADMAELVYPAGFDESWNAIGCCGKAAAKNVNDIAFLKALAARVDPGHKRPIYVVGYSNGGRMAYRMACSAPGVFDATVIVKAMPMPGCVVTRPQSILQIDALNDPAVPYQPGDPGRETPAATVEIGRLRATDRCTQSPVVARYPGMTLTTWGNCTSGTRVEFAVYASGGHGFPVYVGKTPGAAALAMAFFTKTAVKPPPAT